MRLQIKGNGVDVSDSVRSYAEHKLGKLERQLADPTQVELKLKMERNPAIAANHVAEATIWTKGPTLRAREASSAWEASIDELVAKLERQVKRYREKRSRRAARGSVPSAVQDAQPDGADGVAIVKTKQFALKPMSSEEAVLQLELVGHDFFVFKNADSGDFNVVYRRREGNYGLIEPE